MKTIYSIIYVTLNATLNERVSIGLLMSNGSEHYFNYSAEKLLPFKNILDAERYSMVKSYLKSLEKEISLSRENINEFIEKKEFEYDWINENYIRYLSKYSNNIIQFSPPKNIDIELNSSNYRRIFEKYIRTNEIDIYSKVKVKLFPKIENRVNIERIITANDFENLFAPIEIDFIGKNGIPVAGQTIDFEKKHYYLENDVTRFVSLIKAIELKDNKKGKYYVLGREPQTRIDKNQNHLLWEQIRDSDFLEFIDVDEVGIVQEYIENNNVSPYFS